MWYHIISNLKPLNFSRLWNGFYLSRLRWFKDDGENQRKIFYRQKLKSAHFIRPHILKPSVIMK